MKKILGSSLLLGKRLNYKYLLMTKFFIFFMFITTMQSFAKGFGQETVTIKIEKEQFKSALKAIQDQGVYRFVYKDNVLPKDKKVSINVTNADIRNVLMEVFKNTTLSFRFISEKLIVISAEGDKVGLSTDVVNKITGKIVNEKGQPLEGVTVRVKNTNVFTTSGSNGFFSVETNELSGTLVISYVGMQTVEIPMAGKTDFNVTLKAANTDLSDVVVVGYGTVKKSDLTGAVVSISKKDIGDRLSTNIGSLIQGRATGVDVSGDKIRIRGVTTLNNTDPLVVIDGILGGDLGSVNVNNIQNIEILKDASSTAIYGSRGANGVIIVTTKGGVAGPLKVNFNSFYSSGSAYKKLDVLSARQYVDFIKDLRTSVGLDLTDKLKTPDVLVDRTDWQDAITQQAIRKEVNVDFSGGTEDARYFFGFGYRDNKDINIGPSNNQFFITNKNTFNINKYLKLGTNIQFRFSNNKGTAPWQPNAAINFPTYYAIKDSTNLGGYSNVNRAEDLTDIYNPVPQSTLSDSKGSGINYMASTWLEVTPLPGLVWKTQFTATGSRSSSEGFNYSYINGGAQFYDNGLGKSSSEVYTPLLENYLTYTKKYGIHTISAMVGNTYSKYGFYNGFGISGSTFENDRIRLVTAGATSRVAGDSKDHWASLSYFGRLNYSLMDRYLVTFNFRSDASYKFSKANQTANFPAVALAWKVSEESFMKNLQNISQLKIRASYGSSGNDAIPAYGFVSNVSNNPYYVLGGVLVNGATVIDNYSPNIKWETTKSTDLGLDLGLLNNKINITADYFNKNTNDILFAVPTPTSLGYGGNRSGGDPIVNAASVKNTGFELALNYRNKAKALDYSVTGTFTYVKNNVVSLGAGQPFLASNGFSRTDIGNPIGYFYGYTFDKIYKNQADVDADNNIAQQKGKVFYQNAFTRAGDVKFKDINGDGTVDSKDRGNIGSPIPTVVYGLNASFGYKGFDANLVFAGAAGNKIIYGDYASNRGLGTIYNKETYVLDRWKSESNPGNGKVPRAILGDAPENNRISSMMIEDASYFSIRQLSVGYSFNSNVLGKLSVDRLRVYISTENLLMITNFTGFDPTTYGDNLVRGISGYGPITRSVAFGVQFGF